MTLARHIFPNSTYIMTRRINQRLFLLKPRKNINHLFRFCVAYASYLYKMEIHGLVVMSNHWHVVLTDPHGRIPEFAGWVHKNVAKGVNAGIGRWENVWSSEQTSYVRIVDTNDMVDKLLYVLLNPVESRLVKQSKQWPGVITKVEDYCNKSQTITKPDIYFRKAGIIPEKVKFKVTPLPGFEHYTEKQFANFMRKKLLKKQGKTIKKYRKMGKQFLGVHGVLNQDINEQPWTAAPHREMSPQIAEKNKWRRMEMITELKVFQTKYKKAMMKLKLGEKDVVFPAGTYFMRRFFGVKCEEYGNYASDFC
jgi:REP-associated tyrosine transposase